jgi:uncharacterized protein (TIGR03083 family)
MDYLDEIRRESSRFYDVAATADPTAPVPSCPDWNIADLVWHLGEVHWFWATDVETRATDPDAIERDKPQRPSEYGDVVAFGRAQAERLLRVLGANGDDTPVWTWALQESEHNVGFVRRHQVQEAAVHRWDLENAATGSAAAIAPDVASDSIDEVLHITVPWSVNDKKPLPGTVHLHCTDTEGEWFVAVNGAVERVHKKGDVAIRGSASDLLLAGYKRLPLEVVEFVGDESIGREFLGRIDGN